MDDFVDEDRCRQAFGGADGSTGDSTATQPIGGHHRLPLPPPAVGFSTTLGKQYLRAALWGNEAECYFRLAEAFTTQSETTFCGLATLVMVLNALEVDPGRKWKQNWRWYDESMLACCVDLEQIKKDGIIWRHWCHLAQEHGLSVKPTLVVNSTIDAFRQVVRTVTACDDRVLVLNYNRAVVGQAGDGHYSPVGAYLADEDMILIFDVARFKHPPHWLPLSLLWSAMLKKDPVTGFARGFAVLQRDRAHLCGHPVSCCILLSCGRGRLLATHAYFSGNDQNSGGGERGGRCKMGESVEQGGGEMPALATQARRSCVSRHAKAATPAARCGWLASVFGRPSRMQLDSLASQNEGQPTREEMAVQRGCRWRGRMCTSDRVHRSLARCSVVRATAGAESAEEELWLAMRSMPAAAAALAAVRDEVNSAADEEASAHFDRSRVELTQMRVHRALTQADGRFRKRDGPLPVSIDACAILSLLLCAIVHRERLRSLLPRAAPLLLGDEEPLLADGVGSAIAKHILCSRKVLEAEIACRGIHTACT